MSLILLAHVVDGLVAAPRRAPVEHEDQHAVDRRPSKLEDINYIMLDMYIDSLLFKGASPLSSDDVMNGIPPKPVPGAPGGAAATWNTDTRVRQVLGDAAYGANRQLFTESAIQQS